MYNNSSEMQQPLACGEVVSCVSGKQYIIDKLIARGMYSITYLAHENGSTRFVALKELFPRNVQNVRFIRDPEGRINIQNSLLDGFYSDNLRIWQDMRELFFREVRLTQKAGMVYGKDGDAKEQNNIDVLQIEGPFESVQGNWYVSVDTFYGESLRDFIKRGFDKTFEEIKSNQFVSELLDIMIDITIKLSVLHGNQVLLHLDLSPDNIYLSPMAGGTRLNPYIIDYGSAYDLTDCAEQIQHQYTCNSYSAPEVMALAELQSSSCGYTADFSSDTYSLTAILFYALTGRIFSSELRLFPSKWKMQIWSEYSAGFGEAYEKDSFAAALIRFFERGLAAEQRERFQTTRDLYEALSLLKKRYNEYANMLPLIGRDELMTYMVVEKYPLYRYRNSDGDIHVLCIGGGVFVQQMILTLISCGQMLDGRLHIHVVSNETEVRIKCKLLEKAPELKKYSNIDGKSQFEYVTFSFEKVEDILNEPVCKGVLDRYSTAHYLLVSLGNNRSNMDTANLCAKILFEKAGENHRRVVINYYCAEDVANNTSGNIKKQKMPDWIEVNAFGNSLSGYTNTMRVLGMRTLRVAHLYDRLSDSRTSLWESAKKLIADNYAQKSSCASAIHLKYKLASAGIDPDSENLPEIIGKYFETLSTEKRGRLLELEHRRWIMFMIADGYSCPDLHEIKLYGFETIGDPSGAKFNNSWKCTNKKLHPCLVACNTRGRQISPEAWEQYSTWEQIAASDFDPLDKTSLLLHILSRHKCLQRQNKVKNLFAEIAGKLSSAEEEAAVFPAENMLQQDHFGALKKILHVISHDICLEVEQLTYKGDHGKLHALLRAFSDLSINISEEVYQLTNMLSVFIEYASFKDYKEPDEVIVSFLPWLLYSGEKLTLIKPVSKTIAENMTGPLAIEPVDLVYLGMEDHAEWTMFLREQGYLGALEYRALHDHSVNAFYNAMEDVILQHQNKCVVDITGANECAVIAVQRLTVKYANVAIIRSDETGVIEDIHRFGVAPAYKLTRGISAREIYMLHGAQEIPGTSGQYMIQLTAFAPALWRLFLEYKQVWEMTTAFFAHRRTSGAGLWIEGLKIDDTTQWKEYHRNTVAGSHWDTLQLTPIFEQLDRVGIIRKLSIKEHIGMVYVSFQYPSSDNDYVFRAFNRFFAQRVPIATIPFTCEIKNVREHVFDVDIKNACLVDCYSKKLDFSDQRNAKYGEGRRFPYAAMEPILRRAEELGLISDLDFSISPEERVVSIKFSYPNISVRECLQKEGNVLELYTWNEARKTKNFDDCAANFSFRWKENVKNEVDVVLTKGLKSLIISCKTAKYNKAHLYEIKYLTDRFSVNSKPVIIYSSEKAVENGHLSPDLNPVKNRAKAMGVYLIDLNEIEEGTLGEKLIQIMSDTVQL